MCVTGDDDATRITAPGRVTVGGTSLGLSDDEEDFQTPHPGSAYQTRSLLSSQGELTGRRAIQGFLGAASKVYLTNFEREQTFDVDATHADLFGAANALATSAMGSMVIISVSPESARLWEAICAQFATRPQDLERVSENVMQRKKDAPLLKRTGDTLQYGNCTIWFVHLAQLTVDAVRTELIPNTMAWLFVQVDSSLNGLGTAQSALQVATECRGMVISFEKPAPPAVPSDATRLAKELQCAQDRIAELERCVQELTRENERLRVGARKKKLALASAENKGENSDVVGLRIREFPNEPFRRDKMDPTRIFCTACFRSLKSCKPSDIAKHLKTDKHKTNMGKLPSEEEDSASPPSSPSPPPPLKPAPRPVVIDIDTHIDPLDKARLAAPLRSRQLYNPPQVKRAIPIDQTPESGGKVDSLMRGRFNGINYEDLLKDTAL